MPKIKEACEMRIIFMLPPDKYPLDHPYGSDLDNLLKRVQDALNRTIFSEVPGKDGCVVGLSVKKYKAKDRKSGAWLEIYKIK